MEIISDPQKFWNTVHAKNYEFYGEFNHVIQRESESLLDPDLRGLFASLVEHDRRPADE
jgi:hypothetical protein